MRDEMEERCKLAVVCMVQNQYTIRQVARKFGISKSSVHKYIQESLQQADMELYQDTKALIAKNKAERHIRGGMATKIKYARRRMLKT